MRMVDLRDVDKQDESTLHRWWEIYRDAQSDRPVDYTIPWDVARVALPTTRDDFHVELFAAYDGELMVGAGLVNLPMSDNPHLAYLDVYVDWAQRRRGVGTLLLAEVERRAGVAGRMTTLVDVFTLPGGTSPGSAFAEARGYSLGNREGVKAIYLAESEKRWAELEGDAAAALGDYRVLEWDTVVPEEYAVGYCAMLGGFIAMVPTGELEIMDGDWTIERLRASEQHARDIDQRKILAVAVAPDGTLAGCTDLRVNLANTATAYIGMTMVMPEHRGHRLGLAMKLATHRTLRAEYPECELVVTSNADVNEQMNAINQALGYRVVEQLLEYQGRL